MVAIAIGLVMSRSPQTLIGNNSVLGPIKFETSELLGAVCQGDELLPAGTEAIRFATDALVGPRVTLRVTSGRRVIAAGAQDAGWSGKVVTVPISPAIRSDSHVTLCLTIPARFAVRGLAGTYASPASAATNDGRALPIRVRTEYITQGHTPWWSLASTVARHMGFGHAWNGAWIVPFLMAMMLATIVIGSRLLLRELK